MFKNPFKKQESLEVQTVSAKPMLEATILNQEDDRKINLLKYEFEQMSIPHLEEIHKSLLSIRWDLDKQVGEGRAKYADPVSTIAGSVVLGSAVTFGMYALLEYTNRNFYTSLNQENLSVATGILSGLFAGVTAQMLKNSHNDQYYETVAKIRKNQGKVISLISQIIELKKTKEQLVA